MPGKYCPGLELWSWDSEHRDKVGDKVRDEGCRKIERTFIFLVINPSSFTAASSDAHPRRTHPRPGREAVCAQPTRQSSRHCQCKTVFRPGEGSNPRAGKPTPAPLGAIHWR